MGYIVHDFKCDSCGHKYDRLVERGAVTDECPKCQSLANRIISAPRFKLEGITGDFPTAADKWATLHETETKRAYRRKEQDREPNPITHV